MDWDSTLAHWPYHGLRMEAVQFLTSKNIDFALVGTAFPNLNTGENLMLNGDDRQFSAIDFTKNQYVFASNVFNDLSESDYQILEHHWALIWKGTRHGIWIQIFEKKLF